jgi:hypothetical protein
MLRRTVAKIIRLLRQHKSLLAGILTNILYQESRGKLSPLSHTDKTAAQAEHWGQDPDFHE